MQTFKSLLFLGIFTSFGVFSQMNNNGPSGQPSPTPTAAASTTSVQTGKVCPFEVSLEGYIDQGNLTKINTLATSLKAAGGNNSAACQTVGTNIGALLQLVDPVSFNPQAAATPTASPTPGGGMSGGPSGGGPGTNSGSTQSPKPPETCATNPQRCNDLLTTLMQSYKDGSCGSSGAGIANAIVGLGLKIGAAAGPEGAAVALGAAVVMDIYNIVKENSGAIGKANKLNKEQMEMMKNNIKGLMACMANDTYYSSICRPIMYDKIVKYNPPRTRGAGGPSQVKDEDLKTIYSCLLTGKTKQECIKGIKNSSGEQVSDSDFVIDQKVLDSQSVTQDFINDNQLQTFIKTAEGYHDDKLSKLSSDYGREAKFKSYSKNSYRTINLNLIKSCFYDYVPAHMVKNSPHRFDNNVSENFDRLCGKLNSCLSKINSSDKTQKLPTFDIFTGGNQEATDETACSGIIQLETLDETLIADALATAEFNERGVCKTSTEQTGTKESSTNKD